MIILKSVFFCQKISLELGCPATFAARIETSNDLKSEQFQFENQVETKGSRQMKKPEIVWFFTKHGGGRYPQTKLFPFFSQNFFIALK